MDHDALEELQQLKYRYLRTLDLKRWDEFAATLTEDVTASYGPALRFDGRAAVVDFMRNSLGPRSSPSTGRCSLARRSTATPTHAATTARGGSAAPATSAATRPTSHSTTPELEAHRTSLGAY